MAEDERKTLLRFEGDAEGAKKAARETREAVKSVGDATESAGKKTADTTKAATQAVKEQGEAAGEAKESFDDMAKGMGTSEREANALKETIGRLNPRLALLLDLVIKGKAAMAAMFSPFGLMVTAAIASVVVLGSTIKDTIAATRAARDEWEALQESQREGQSRSDEQGEQVADVLARAGISSPAAVTKATGIKRRLERKGFSQRAAMAVLPLVVTPEGEQAVSDEQLQDLALRAEYGKGNLTVESGRDRERVRKRELRRIRSPRGASDAQALREAFHARTARETERIQAGDRPSIAARMKRQGEQFDTEEEEQQAITEVLAVRDKGGIDMPPGLKPTGSVKESEMSLAATNRRAFERARRMGMVSPEKAMAGARMTAKEVTERQQEAGGDGNGSATYTHRPARAAALDTLTDAVRGLYGYLAENTAALKEDERATAENTAATKAAQAATPLRRVPQPNMGRPGTVTRGFDRVPRATAAAG